MAQRSLTIVIFIISAAVFLQQCQGQPTLMCDNFCSNNVVTCTCEDAGNPSNMTVWKLVNSSTSCSITLNQTGACNATSNTCATIPGIMAVNDPPMMTGAPCDSSTLHIIKGNTSLERLQIDCMSPDGTSYGGIGFSTNPPSTPTISLCAVSSTDGFLVVNPATDGVSGIPTSYNVTISTGGETIIETLRALSNGTATYNFTYSGSGVPSVIATAINCAGNATSNGTNTFPPCKGPATPTSLPSASTSTPSVPTSLPSSASTSTPSVPTSLPSASTSTPSVTTNTLADGTVIGIAVGVPVSVILVVSLGVASVLCCLLRRSCRGSFYKPRSQAAPSSESKEMFIDKTKEVQLEIRAT